MATRRYLIRSDSEVRVPSLGASGRQRRAFPVTGSQSAQRSSSSSALEPSTPYGDPVSPSAASAGTPSRSKVPRPPVQLTKEVLLNSTSVTRKRGENDENFLRRLTHLQLQGLRLGPDLPKINLASGVCVLYAYDNLLSSLEGFETLRRLQQLYLQNNRLTSLVGLEGLTSLRKLHVGSNLLGKIDGLMDCPNLEELHVPNQRMRRGEVLQFCPETIASLGPSLLVLNASRNRIQDASCLEPLHRLQSLDLSDNEFQQFQNISAVLTGAPGLVRVQLSGNHLAIHERRYRHSIVLLASAIEEIDGKEVLPQERDFVRRLDEQKRKLQMQRERHLGRHGLGYTGVSPSGAPDTVAHGEGKKVFASSGPGKAGLDHTATPPVLQDLVT